MPLKKYIYIYIHTYTLASFYAMKLCLLQYMLCALVEYGMGIVVSIYDDVYSYSMLLFEMFTGKRPIDDIFDDSLNLCDFVKANLPERIIDIIDPILLPKRQEGKRRMNDTCNENQDGSLKIQECFTLVLGIGIACSKECPRKRMNISVVVVKLHSIRQSLD